MLLLRQPVLFGLVASFCFAAELPASETNSEPLGHRSKLFDGRSLSGWTAQNDAKVTVQDDALLLKSGDGWLRSDQMFRDFKLSLSWKALKEGDYDAGIYIRTPPGGRPFPKQGYQVNLLDGKEGNIARLPGASSSGLVRRGEWNRFEITVIGETVRLDINGQHAYTARGLKIPIGHVGLQVEVPKGGQFLVKEIEITEYGYQSLFNKKDLSAWEGAGQPADACWKVENETIVCSGEPGPWLRTRDQFGNFNFRFEYQVSPGGNSGVYVRVPPDGNHHRKNENEKPAGFEVQILDDHAAKHAKLKDYQYCGSVYDIAGASPRVSKPAGEWNTMEIDCAGQTITVGHNGILVTRVTEETHPLISLRQLKGHLGLQNHKTVVRYRNLRIGPAVKEYPAAAE